MAGRTAGGGGICGGVADGPGLLLPLPLLLVLVWGPAPEDEYCEYRKPCEWDIATHYGHSLTGYKHFLKALSM